MTSTSNILFEAKHRHKWQNTARVAGSMLAGTVMHFPYFKANQTLESPKRETGKT
jgi:hypothetical protein